MAPQQTNFPPENRPNTHDEPSPLDVDSPQPNEEIATRDLRSPRVVPDTDDGIPSIPGYRIEAQLGRGGMGVVYKALQVGLNRVVALKMIASGRFAQPENLLRFYQEAEAIACLDHPNIVRIHSVDTVVSPSSAHDPVPVYVMEYVEGGDLRASMEDGVHSPNKAAQLIETLARAIHHAHEHGILHRDLKPENVMMTADGQPKIGDFGLVKQFDRVSGEAVANSPTQTGVIMGTPEYMAPEQALGKNEQLGPAVDIYALGVILYELLTDRRPFEGVSDLETLELIRDQEPVSPRRLQPKLERDLETICLKCLEKEADNRYQTAENLAEDLRRFHEGEPILARRISPLAQGWRWVRRNRLVAMLLMAIVLTLVIGSGVATWFGWSAHLQAERADLEAKEADANAVVAARKTEEARTQTAQAKASEAKAKTSAAQAKASEAKAVAEAERAERAKNEAEQLVYNYQNMLAYNQWKEGQPDEALNWLEQTRWDLRDWGYRYHRRLFDGRQTFIGHVGPRRGVLCVACSSDGQLFASGGNDQNVFLWERWSGQERFLLNGHKSAVSAVAFSPDDRYLASGDEDGVLRLWDVETGTLLFEKKRTPLEIAGLAFRPDGKQLLVRSLDSTIRLCDSTTGDVMQSFEKHKANITSAAWSPDGCTIASRDRDGVVYKWNTESLELESSTSAPKTKDPGRVFFDSEGELWVFTWVQDRATFHKLDGKQRPRTLRTSANILDGYYDPARHGVALVDAVGAVHLVQVASGRRYGLLRGHHKRITQVAFAGSAPSVVCGSLDNRVTATDLVQSQESTPARIPPSVRHHLSDFRFDINRACGPTNSGKALVLWNPETGEVLDKRTGMPARFVRVVLSSDGTFAVGTASDRSLKRWDVQTKTLTTLGKSKAPLHKIFLSPNDRFLVTVAQDNEVCLWDANSGKRLRVGRAFTFEPASVAFSPQGNTVVWLERNTKKKSLELVLYDCATGNPLWRIDAKSLAQGLHFSPDGEWVIYDGSSNWIVCDARTGQEHWQVPKAGLVSIAMSPDSKLLAYAVSNNHVRVVERESGNELVELEGNEAHFCNMIFTLDSRQLVTVDVKGYIKFWEFRGGQPTLILRSAPSTGGQLQFTDSGRALTHRHQQGITLWKSGKPRNIYRLEGMSSQLFSLAINSKGTRLAALAVAGDGRVWNTQTGETLFSFRSEKGITGCCAFTPDDQSLAVTRGKTIEIHDLQTRAVTTVLQSDGSRLGKFAFSPVGDRIVATDIRGNLSLWEYPSGNLLAQFEGHRTICRDLAFSPDGNRLASLSFDHTVRIWDLRSKTCLHILRSERKGGYTSPAFHPDGTCVALASGPTITLLDVKSGKPVAQFDTDESEIASVAFTPDGKRILTGGERGAVRMWNLATQEEVFHLRAHLSDVRAIVPSPVGNWIATAADDQYVFWFQPTGKRMGYPADKITYRKFRVRE